MLLLLLVGCQKEEIKTLTKENDQFNSSTQAGVRAYEQDVCGFVEKFCSAQKKALPASIEDDLIKFRVNNNVYQAFPIKIYDGNIGVFVIEGGNAFVMHKNNNSKLSEKNTSHTLPQELSALLTINYQNNFNNNHIYSQIEQKFNKTFSVNTEGRKEMDISDTPLATLSSFEAVLYCNFELVSNVDDFWEVFGDPQNSNMYDFIEAAYLSCPAAYPNFYDGVNSYNCSNDCIDPRCVVDKLLNGEDLSNDQKHLIVARYLSETIELTGEEQAWLELTSNTDFARSIYDGFAVDRNINRCDGTDCGILGGYHEAIIQRRAGEILTSQETEGLLDFFSVMRCDDGEIYKCFREAQRNPESEVAALLNSIKAEVMMDNFALLDECDNVAEYAERWTDLGTFNPLSVAQVSDRLNGLADGTWVQTLENAQPEPIQTPLPAFPYWWNYSPAVNMDFFAINIESLPLNPDVIPSVPFENSGEFLEFVRRNFVSDEFYGAGSPCSGPLGLIKSFDYSEPSDQPRWLVSDPLSTIFTITLPDDGSVICSKYVPGNNWVFSTLNVPGWNIINGNSDGYHPVSGNREFGILENANGTYTFYTSGVDRVTGWWHAAFEDLAFYGGSDFWACFLDTMSDYINLHGGVASDDDICLVIKPKWVELREILKQGCDGLVNEIENFPCEQFSACQ